MMCLHLLKYVLSSPQEQVSNFIENNAYSGQT